MGNGKWEMGNGKWEMKRRRGAVNPWAGAPVQAPETRAHGTPAPGRASRAADRSTASWILRDSPADAGARDRVQHGDLHGRQRGSATAAAVPGSRSARPHPRATPATVSGVLRLAR